MISFTVILVAAAQVITHFTAGLAKPSRRHILDALWTVSAKTAQPRTMTLRFSFAIRQRAPSPAMGERSMRVPC
ncbi:hypothetical protein BDN70DRAFT_883600 [Pholiota conissans]|uniref:Secreted protein n=1 Tax=Pholiota conissans TaxID=109636 RepID=A0A9P5YVY1_9AGAR|nr:hypothetical protein BDN70DRAFT_883600 [Pholiota conissans]